MNQEVIARAINTYGREAQMRQCIEEMAELTQAICKHRRALEKDDIGFLEYDAAFRNLVEETADVYVMIQQMIIMVGEEKVKEQIDFKIDRLQKRLEEKNE